MTAIIWGKSGERLFEAGVDRGVLYRDDAPGVPWNGLTGVNESISGGDPKPFYYEGYKYLNLSAAEEFSATITAYSAPLEFLECDGQVHIAAGLYITQQARLSFGFSYRTLLGNDIESIEHGYKIHLVYNALTEPSERSNQTLSENVSAMEISWTISTAPPRIVGRRPTAHFIIDTSRTPPKLVKAIEDILYGTETDAPRMPSAQELIDIFSVLPPVTRRNLFYGAEGRTITQTTFQSSAGSTVGVPTPETYVFDDGPASAVKATLSASSATFMRASLETAIPADALLGPISFSAWIRSAKSGFFSITVAWFNGATPLKSDKVLNRGVIPADQYTLIPYANLAPPPNATRAVYSIEVAAAFATNDYLFVTAGMVNVGPQPHSYFSGSTPSTGRHQYAWEGAVNASPSIERSWY